MVISELKTRYNMTSPCAEKNTLTLQVVQFDLFVSEKVRLLPTKLKEIWKQNTPEIIYSHNFLDAFVKTWLITTFAVFASGKSESTRNSQQG